MTQIPAELLTMSLTELRERVELAERLALASRYVTPGTQYAGNSGAVQPQITESLQSGNQAASTSNTASGETDGATPRKRRATTKTEPAPAPAPTSNPSSSGPSAEELFNAAETADTGGAASTDFSLDDLDAANNEADDMLADFSLDGPAEDNTDWRAVLTAMAAEKQTKWKAANDGESLKRPRALMSEFGVERIGDLPDEKLKAFHDKFKPL